MECPICFTAYALPDREPKVLNCGHTFCQQCVAQLNQRNNVCCPTCRADTPAAEVRVNFALRDVLALDNGNSSTVVAPQPPRERSPRAAEAVEPQPVSDAEVSVEVKTYFAHAPDEATGGAVSGIRDFLISLIPPAGEQRTPSDICCVVDVSDSMGTEALVQEEEGSRVSHGLTLLDVVKHALRTIIHNLGAQDRLSLAYASDARTIFELTSMTEAGKRTTESQLSLLQLNGMTNLWSGLEMGISKLKAEPGRLQHVMLLTDGVPTLNPPRGVVPMLRRLKDKAGGSLPCTINTFGFGYDLDSDLLSDIATIGCGTYAFIPDSGFVGTVFVNAMTNLLTTMATNVTLCVELLKEGQLFADPAVLGGHPYKRQEKRVNTELSPLQFGQSKDVLLRMVLPNDSQCNLFSDAVARVTLKYTTRAHGDPSVIETSVSGTAAWRNDESLTLERQRCRTAFVDGVRAAIKMTKLTNMQKIQGVQMPLPEAQARIQQAVDVISASPAGNGPEAEAIAALLEDLTGQTAEAFSREDWFTKWGIHFLPSLMCAHLCQQCNNFKDPGVQWYGGDLFGDLRDQADEIFCNLPPPVPSTTSAPRRGSAPAAVGAGAGGGGWSNAIAAASAAAPAASAPIRVAAPVSMSAYYDRYSG